jgi:hypothetical protein
MYKIKKDAKIKGVKFFFIIIRMEIRVYHLLITGLIALNDYLPIQYENCKSTNDFY